MQVLEYDQTVYAKNVYIYGTTVGGRIIFQLLERNGVAVKGFYDRCGQPEILYGLPVDTPDRIAADGSVIIVALTRSFQSALRTLELRGIHTVYQCSGILEKYSADDFIFSAGDRLEVESFLKNYSFYAAGFAMEKEIVIPMLEAFITERCTLRCRDCSHLIPYYKKPTDYDISAIIRNLSNLLKIADRISELYILGGEPLLHHGIVQLLYWAYHNPNIGSLRIITNGTVIPGGDVLKCIRDTGTELRFSDYGKLSGNLEGFTSICEAEGIPYLINREKWTDMGEIRQHDYSEEKIRQMFQDCPFVFSYLLLKGRLFRCAHIAHLNNQGHISTYGHDSVELDHFGQEDTERKKKELQELLCADYLSGCRYCNGVNDGTSDTEPAVQLDGSRRLWL